MYTLYMLTFCNGKSYVGQTIRPLKTRISQHRTSSKAGSMLPVHCAFRAHGEPDVIVLSTHETREALNAAEVEAISKLGTVSPSGYNIGFGGETSPALNPEVAKKIGNKVRGMKRSKEQAESMSDSAKALWADGEYRKAVSEGLKGAWTEEKRKQRGEMMKRIWAERKAAGWSMPESTKEKLRNRVISEESRRKNSEAHKGVKRNPSSAEARKNISIAQKRYWMENHEEAAKRGGNISKALKQRFENMTDDQKAAFSAARKKSWETRRAKSSPLLT